MRDRAGSGFGGLRDLAQRAAAGTHDMQMGLLGRPRAAATSAMSCRNRACSSRRMWPRLVSAPNWRRLACSRSYSARGDSREFFVIFFVIVDRPSGLHSLHHSSSGVRAITHSDEM